MALPPTRVRGIYATALTRLLIDQQVPIAEPSAVIAERFALSAGRHTPTVRVQDRRDRQGIEAHGEANAVRSIVNIIRSELPRTVVRPAERGLSGSSLEFPAWAKIGRAHV